jgi:putative endonuclease
MSRARIGGQAESIAAAFLKMKGYSILATNYRFHRNEIDIVASVGERLVFVEVKCRTTAAKGLPGEAVGPEKMRRIVRAASGFLTERRWAGRPVRFDVIEVTLERGGLELSLRHLVGVFGADCRRW